MNPERWQRVKQIYQSALEVEPAGREIFLREKCTGDEALLQEVHSLLNQGSQSPLDSPALDGEARALAQEQSSKAQPDLVGQTLQHYRIIEKIGAGGMGVVYRARDEHLRRDVALKVLPPELVADPERKKRFIREARAASALNHSNIVTIYDVTSKGGVDFIAMELVAGKTLDQKIGRKGLKLGEALKYAIQMADALAAAHAAGIVHRDLKPANILVTESGQVKVLDFGLAKLTQPLNGERADSSSAALSTEEGRIIGTAAYMSPEQAEGKTVDARSDIFSFGAVLYEMLSGMRAFQGESSASVIAEILKSEPAPLSAAIPNDLNMIITRCLRKDPARRFQHMDDIKVALEDFKENTASGELNQMAAHAKPVRWRVLIWVSSTLLLVLAVSAAYFYVKSLSKPQAPLKVVPLTSYPGSQRSPSFSPDGSRVAFSWNGEKEDNFDIYIKPIGAGPARRLTSDPASDTLPKWSPDGNWISFARGGFTYLISPEGGAERKLCLGNAYSWTPDGKFLAIDLRESVEKPWMVYLVSVETGQKEGPLTSPQPGRAEDALPLISPNGRSMAFMRYLRSAYFLASVYVLPLANGKPGGEPWRLTNDNLRVGSLAWTTDSREIVFSSKYGGRTSLWRMAVSPGADPQRIPGTDDGATPTISRSTPTRLVYSRGFRNDNIWHMQITGNGTIASVPERLISSKDTEWDPQFSPNGDRIAFRSNRTGFSEIMVCNSDGSNPVPLTSFNGARQAGSPRWSPDGRRIAFDSEGPDNAKIFVIDAEGGALHKLTTGDWYDIRPSWSRNGGWIYFGSNRSGTFQIWKLSATGENIQQVTRNGGMEAFESPDGMTLFYANEPATPGIWKIPVQGGEEAAIPTLSAVNRGYWAVADRGIYFVDFTGVRRKEPVPVRYFDFQTQELSQIGTIEKIIMMGICGFSVTRDGGRMIWTQIDRSESNLMLIDNFR
jgi:eukaryotic-like serine/threonine-protein kinase